VSRTVINANDTDKAGEMADQENKDFSEDIAEQNFAEQNGEAENNGEHNAAENNQESQEDR